MDRTGAGVRAEPGHTGCHCGTRPWLHGKAPESSQNAAGSCGQGCPGLWGGSTLGTVLRRSGKAGKSSAHWEHLQKPNCRPVPLGKGHFPGGPVEGRRALPPSFPVGQPSLSSSLLSRGGISAGLQVPGDQTSRATGLALPGAAAPAPCVPPSQPRSLVSHLSGEAAGG